MLLNWLPGCTSIRRGRPGWAEPEIYFRIIHVTLDARNGGPVAAYREQTVEIALGPKGAFENGNIGTLTRRIPAAPTAHAAVAWPHSTTPCPGAEKPGAVLTAPSDLA